MNSQRDSMPVAFSFQIPTHAVYAQSLLLLRDAHLSLGRFCDRSFSTVQGLATHKTLFCSNSFADLRRGGGHHEPHRDNFLMPDCAARPVPDISAMQTCVQRQMEREKRPRQRQEN